MSKTKKNGDIANVIPSFDSPKNWTEDYEGKIGGYINKCVDCKNTFLGDKRRYICKECFKLPY